MDRILIEVPTWLGDCVMATSAIENIVKIYPRVKITIFGSVVASAVFVHHPNVECIIIDKSRQAKSRYWWLYNVAKKLEFDCVFSFRKRFSAKFFAYFIQTKSRYHYQRYTQNIQHQVVRYNDFINQSLGINTEPNKLKIYTKFRDKTSKKILGINPGASYGSAKRWYPREFAKVASALSGEYDIVIFGGSDEVEIAYDIEQLLIEHGVTNYQNLASKTSIQDLIEKIAQLDLFITGDSGPMHIAAAFQVPTVAIFGPTKDDETSQWMNEKSEIVKQNLECQPCMKRICPLQHHNCMKLIKATDVLYRIQQINTPI